MGAARPSGPRLSHFQPRKRRQDYDSGRMSHTYTHAHTRALRFEPVKTFSTASCYGMYRQTANSGRRVHGTLTSHLVVINAHKSKRVDDDAVKKRRSAGQKQGALHHPAEVGRGRLHRVARLLSQHSCVVFRVSWTQWRRRRGG